MTTTSNTANATGFDKLANGLLDTLDHLVTLALAQGATTEAEVQALVLDGLRQLALAA